MRSDPPPPEMPDSPLSASFCYAVGTGRPDRSFARRLTHVLISRGGDAGPLVAVIPRGPGLGPRRMFALAARVLRDPSLAGTDPDVLGAREAERRGLVRQVPTFTLDVDAPPGKGRLRHPDGRAVTMAEFESLTGAGPATA